MGGYYPKDQIPIEPEEHFHTKMTYKAYFFECIGNELQRKEKRAMDLAKTKSFAGKGGNPPRR